MLSAIQTMQVPFVDLQAQYAEIEPEVTQAMTTVLHRADFILGQDVELFEEEFAAYCEVKHAVGVDSGTSALELLLRAYGIGPGDEVITVANTFIASVLAISATGARPVLVDIDPATYNLDVDQLENAITPRTKAILPVHLYGLPADMDAILEIAQRQGAVVIEDACQAHGARYKGKRAGSLGHAAAFSFYPAKNLGAYGDAGMATTDDDHIAARLRMLRDYGQQVKYHHIMRGYNRRLDTLQAAVLRVKLGHLDTWNRARREHSERYHRLLAESAAILPTHSPLLEPVYHLFVIRTAERDALRAYLQSHGIGTGIHYPVPVHLQQAYEDLGYTIGDFPVTERFAQEILSLPMYPELMPEQIEHVAESILYFEST